VNIKHIILNLLLCYNQSKILHMKQTLLLFCLLLVSSFSFAQEKMENEKSGIDYIKEQGIEHSKVMDIASWVTDVYGPRLTGSPMLDKATEWAVKELKDWGMQNVHLEEWGPFGRGWDLQHFEMHATSPNYFPVLAYPKAWSPSIKGEGEVIYLNAKTQEDLDEYKGKLAGKFVMVDTIRDTEEWFDPSASRYDSEDLLGMANAGVPTPRPRRSRNAGGFNFNKAMWTLIESENPIAVIDRSYKGDLGTVFVSGARTSEGRSHNMDLQVVPQATLSVEHYNRIFRMLNKGIPVKLSMDLQSTYTNDDQMEHNIIAEIPGTDLKDEVVMFGAHFDSWHTGTGATDNGAGSAVMMEVARILLETIKESGVQPRRTLRLALWTGEEQGLFGSRGYVGEHFAEFPPNSYTPQSLKEGQKKVSAYYNLDNGTGKIRGIYTQGNVDVVPVFREWFSDFSDMDAGTITLSNTGGTDHLPFDAVGIPGFQFIQDPMSYFNKTHHSNMDNYDHLSGDDLSQAATIIAAFVWQTSQRDEMLPRKPLDEDLKSGTN
jgi:hypothetical protein